MLFIPPAHFQQAPSDDQLLEPVAKPLVLQLAGGAKLRPTEDRLVRRGTKAANAALELSPHLTGLNDFGITPYESTNYRKLAEDGERSGAALLRGFAITSLDRDIHVQGFNGTKLGASLKATQSQSQLFAVLVQDAGHTDRDGRNSAMPKVRTGLAIAELLQSIGIGSIRYDKRLVGSRDAKLDVSLDAQLGDLLAVISVARALPEAKNKRILVIGHGEGALLALLAASQIDALLMLAPPSGSMAKTIRSQVEAQLPATFKGTNLAYLDSLFQAIRDNGPVPEATVGVLDAISQMGRSLMAPATLGFVKSTLDLDPWAIASRLSIPNAVVWADKDIISFKPYGFSEIYKGSVIEMQNANHHFRQELRPKEGLNGASAASTYSDDAPLADLSAVIAWVKSLFS